MARLAIERKSDCEYAYNILGRAYFASGRFEDAAAIAERAIEVNGEDYNTYLPFRNAMERLGRMKDAERIRERLIVVLRQQLEQVPEDVRARILWPGILLESARSRNPNGTCRWPSPCVPTTPTCSTTPHAPTGF